MSLFRGHPEAKILLVPESGSVLGNTLERLTAWETQILQVDYETYEDRDNPPGRLVTQVRHLLQVVGKAGPAIAAARSNGVPYVSPPGGN